MTKHTPLYQQHIDAGAKMVDFSGWSMPIHYGSQLKEHQSVREHAGVFDVSHMTIVDIKGEDVQLYLQTLLANDISKITHTPGKALYSCLLNHKGFVIDDLIVYFMHNSWFRVIVNSATRNKDINWLNDHIKNLKVTLVEQTTLAMIAIQGPKAINITNNIISLQENIKPFYAIEKDNLFIARTGYTGEDGYEIIAPVEQTLSLWKKLLAKTVKPCGLGARDTLRLEAGMNLYGNDMDETSSPLETGLAWTIDFSQKERAFIGRQALEKQQEMGLKTKLVGIVLLGKGIIRANQELSNENTDNSVNNSFAKVSSGGYSPTLDKSIAFAHVPMTWEKNCLVHIRNKKIPAKIVKLPFIRQGKIINS